MEDFSRYSVEELQRLRAQVEKEIAERRKDHIHEARREIQAIAQRYGFALSDLLDDLAP
ncbi:hypothetical protein CKO15_03030 [Halorhodospira abdelmalekii]|uniref:H-NS family nucleoid-associated regulatory protein n=1 Tax=Halorhodospira abdelmalekii TaxID=421629 RepID=UPI0019052ABB|nr:H-NS family nucleoid-associated regulatory protein [Halorhodospira abdelmalekii]MBK1734271.1 hypothetical protein [Halorhodospira abdelmalekii]